MRSAGRSPPGSARPATRGGNQRWSRRSEPYAFSPVDGPEMFPGRRVALVEGRSLTWYGPSLVTARAVLLEQLAK